MSLKFPISLAGKRVGTPASTPTILYSGETVLVELTGDIPNNWNDFNTPYNATRIEIGTSCTNIGRYAFNNCIGLTGSLVIPDSVTSIDIYAFGSCTGFNGTLTVVNGIIEDSAFFGCSGFTALSIGAGVTVFKAAALIGCTSIANISVDPSNPIYSDNSDGICYDKNKTEIKFGPGVTTLNIIGSVTTIGTYAFVLNTVLTGALTIPNTVRTIQSYAFLGCTGLTGTLTIPSNVTTINYRAFDGCTGFTRIEILATTAPTIRGGAFRNIAPTDGQIHVPAGATGYAASYDGYTVVYDL